MLDSSTLKRRNNVALIQPFAQNNCTFSEAVGLRCASKFPLNNEMTSCTIKNFKINN